MGFLLRFNLATFWIPRIPPLQHISDISIFHWSIPRWLLKPSNPWQELGPDTEQQSWKVLSRVPYGGFHKWSSPKWMVYKWKIPLKWMIWRYPYFRKPPYVGSKLKPPRPLRRSNCLSGFTNQLWWRGSQFIAHTAICFIWDTQNSEQHEFGFAVSSWLLLQLWKASLSTISMQLRLSIRLLTATVSLCTHECAFKRDTYPLSMVILTYLDRKNDHWSMGFVWISYGFSEHFQTRPQRISGPRNPLTQAGKVLNHGRSPNIESREHCSRYDLLPLYQIIG